MAKKTKIDQLVEAIRSLQPEELKELRERLKDLLGGEPSLVGAKPKVGPPSLNAGAEAVIGTDLDDKPLIPNRLRSRRI
jgi:hypothetical protein